MRNPELHTKLQLNINISLKTTNDCSLPLSQGITLITANGIVSVFGSLHGQVCFAIATNPRLRRSSNYLLFSLAIADLIVTLVCEPFLLEMLYNRTFVYGCKPNLERLYSILANLSCSTSVVHLACISADRFIAVLFPLHHEIVMKRCGLKIMLIASWAFPISVPILMVALPPSFSKAFLAIASFTFSYFVVIFSYLLSMVFLLIYQRKRNRCRLGQFLLMHAGHCHRCFHGLLGPKMIALFAAGKSLMKRNGPLHMWPRTLVFFELSHEFSDLLCKNQ